jgi:hypothetical protein
MRNELAIKKSKKGNFFQIGNIFIDQYAEVFGKSASIVYVCMRRHMNQETKTAFPSEKLIAKKLSMSTRTVIRSIKKLESHNAIIKQSKKDNGQWPHNEYFFTLSKDWLLAPGDKNNPTRVTNNYNISDRNNEIYATQRHINNTNNNNTKEQASIFEKDTEFKDYKPDFLKRITLNK